MTTNNDRETDAWADAREHEWRRHAEHLSNDLRQRVLQAAWSELAGRDQVVEVQGHSPVPREAAAKLTRPRSNRDLRWAAFITLSLLWLHFTWSAGSDVPRLGREHISAATAEQVEQLRDLVPELSLAEARRIVATQNAGAQVPAWRSPWRESPTVR